MSYDRAALAEICLYDTLQIEPFVELVNRCLHGEEFIGASNSDWHQMDIADRRMLCRVMRRAVQDPEILKLIRQHGRLADPQKPAMDLLIKLGDHIPF